MSTNSERFLSAFGVIERCLRTLTREQKRTRFYRLVDKGKVVNAAVRRYADDLKEYADLRNAIVHERTDEHVIAEPNDRAVRQIEYIQELLEHPPTVIPTFQKQVYSMTIDDPVAVAAFAMMEHNYSQLPIHDNKGFKGLLSSDDIARWLGRCAPQHTVNLEETTIGEVLSCRCAEAGENYRFFCRTNTVFDVLEAFQSCEKCGTRLDAILITEQGLPDQELLGIITIWDLPQIYETLE